MKNSILLALLLTLSVASYSQPVIKPLWSLPHVGNTSVFPEANRVVSMDASGFSIWAPGNPNPIYSAWLPHKNYLPCAIDSKSIVFGYAERGKKVAVHNIVEKKEIVSLPCKTTNPKMSFGKLNQEILCYTFDTDSLIVWDIANNAWIQSISISGSKEIWDITFSSQDKLLTVISLDSISPTQTNVKHIRTINLNTSFTKTITNVGAHFFDTENLQIFFAKDSTIFGTSLSSDSVFIVSELRYKPAYFTISSKYNKLIARSNNQNEVEIIDLKTKEIETTFTIQNSSTFSILIWERWGVAPWSQSPDQELVHFYSGNEIQFYNFKNKNAGNIQLGSIFNIEFTRIYNCQTHTILFDTRSFAEINHFTNNFTNYCSSIFYNLVERNPKFDSDASLVLNRNRYNVQTFDSKTGFNVGSVLLDTTEFGYNVYEPYFAASKRSPLLAYYSINSQSHEVRIINSKNLTTHCTIQLPSTIFNFGTFSFSPTEDLIAVNQGIYSTLTGNSVQSFSNSTLPTGSTTDFSGNGKKVMFQQNCETRIVDIQTNSIDTIFSESTPCPVLIGDHLYFPHKELYNLSTQKTISFSDSIYNIDVSKNNKYCYQKNDTCFIRSAESNSLLVSFPCSGTLQGFSNSGRFIAVLSLDYNSIYLYDASNTTLLAILQHNRGLDKPQFSPNDSLVLANGSVWDISSLLAINSVPQEIDTNLHMSIAPNPVATELTIKSSCQLPATISLSTAQGVVLQQYQAQSFPFTISTSQFPSGVYSITIKSGNAFVTKQCVVLH